MIEIMLRANLVCGKRQAKDKVHFVPTHLFKEYKARVVHNRLAVGVQRLVLPQMAMYRRCS